jgi:hypothetical protein
MVVAVGVTVLLLVAVTVPMPWSIETEVAPVTFHCRVEDWPVVIVIGLAVKLVIAGTPAWARVIVAVAVTIPALLLAVRVYVVVVVGDTVLLPDAVTVPIPWSIENEVAPVIFHCRVED